MIPSRRFQTARCHVEELHRISKELYEARKITLEERRDDVNVMNILRMQPFDCQFKWANNVTVRENNEVMKRSDDRLPESLPFRFGELRVYEGR